MRVQARRAGTACAMLLGAACRQLVGIGDEPPTDLVDAGTQRRDAGTDAGSGPACGIAYSGPSCEACLEKSCCPEANACASGPACRGLEGCLGACSGDPTCRARCVDAHRIGPDPFETDLASCLATHCAEPCALTCGGLAQDYGADAAAGCQTCMLNHVCNPALACAQDRECQAVAWCRQSNPYLDSVEACDGVHDAGADAFAAFSGDLSNSCPTTCSLGNQWYCVGNLPQPTLSSPPVEASAYFYEYLTNQPVANATVTACSENDVGCSRTLSTATTDDAGLATVRFPGNMQAFGPTGYVQVTGANLFPTLVFWGYSLTQRAVLWIFDTIHVERRQPAVSPSPGPGRSLDSRAGRRRRVGLRQHARLWRTFEIEPSNPDTRIFHVSGGAISLTAASTDSTGGALIVNVPVSTNTVQITATPNALGRVSSIETGFVRAGALTAIGAYVTQ